MVWRRDSVGGPVEGGGARPVSDIIGSVVGGEEGNERLGSLAINKSYKYNEYKGVLRRGGGAKPSWISNIYDFYQVVFSCSNGC